MRYIDVIVIGGGAAGLMCALQAGQRGRSVLVIEGSNKVGKKILMSGGGRCNFTNLRVETDNYVSDNVHFCISALRRFTPQDFLAMVERHGIDHHEREHGQLFCDHSSKDILRMLLDECASAEVEIQTHCVVQNIDQFEPGGSTYRLQTSDGDFECQSLVIATGGLSIPKMGASGFGYSVARQYDLRLAPTRAGLVPLTFSGNFGALCERLSGVSIEAELNLPCSSAGSSSGQRSFLGKLLFTHRGLSGPTALQLSNYWQPPSPLQINLSPGRGLNERLMVAKRAQPKVRLRSILAEYFPRSLVLEAEQAIWSNDSEKPLAEWSERSLVAIADRLQAWQVVPAGTEGYRTAEVTIGGVSCNEISSKTMECKRQPGLYFIGEVVDVTGQLGGFNFQWAWASGHAAGCHV
jgi:predicted Rossmann fold flavoprotein